MSKASKEALKKIKNYVFIFLIGILLMLVSMILVYILPQGRIQVNHGVMLLAVIVLVFFITGMLTSFVDLLTVPILTLGWLLGYGLTWVSKWVIASFVLQENIFCRIGSIVWTARREKKLVRRY